MALGAELATLLDAAKVGGGWAFERAAAVAADVVASRGARQYTLFAITEEDAPGVVVTANPAIVPGTAA